MKENKIAVFLAIVGLLVLALAVGVARECAYACRSEIHVAPKEANRFIHCDYGATPEVQGDFIVCKCGAK